MLNLMLMCSPVLVGLLCQDEIRSTPWRFLRETWPREWPRELSSHLGCLGRQRCRLRSALLIRHALLPAKSPQHYRQSM